MPDVSIVNSTVTSAPTDYTVPGTQELLVKAVRASIDGSGAGSAFLPALQLIDPAGHVMWTAVDTSTTIAAGASADVSWFPDVSRSGGGSSTVNNAQTAYVWNVFGGSQSIPDATANVRVRWQHFQTTDTAIFGTSTNALDTPPFNNATGDSFLYFTAPGAYVVSYQIDFAGGAFAQESILSDDGGQFDLDHSPTRTSPSELVTTNLPPAVPLVGDTLHSTYLCYVDGTTGQGIVSIVATQNSGAAQNVIALNMGVMYLGGTTANLASIY